MLLSGQSEVRARLEKMRLSESEELNEINPYSYNEPDH